MDPTARRPDPSEHSPFYAGYVAKVPPGDVRAFLHAQRDDLAGLLSDIPRARWDHRYAPGKWTVRELVGHVLDGEWVFASRAIHFARGNPGPMPSMDQDAFMAHGNYGARTLPSLARELDDLRSAGLAQYDSFGPEVFDRRGVASGHEITVRALLYVIGGHAQHHADMLRERYL